jgi:outer membrane immunogenic protein
LGLGAPAAFAAERAVPAYAPPPPPVPVYTWTGCYAGANAGTSTGRSTQTTQANSILTGGGLGVPAPAPLAVAGPPGPVIAPVPAGSSIAGDLNLSGFIGGFQGGCNYQWGMWVIGFEGDGMANNKEGQNFEVGLVPFLGNGRANWISQTQERWLVTARGKLGLSGWGWFGDKSMVYVTGVRIPRRRSDRHRPSREQYPHRLDGGRRLRVRTRLRLVDQGRVSLCQV